MMITEETEGAFIQGSSPGSAFSNCIPFCRVNFVSASIINFDALLSKRDVLVTVGPWAIF